MLHPTASPTNPARRKLPPRRERRIARSIACACLAWVTLAGPLTTSATALATGAVTTTAVPSAAVTSSYVRNVYQHLFERAPDDGGLATWTTALRQGVPRVAVANAITSSTEYRTGLVTDAYRSYLGRTLTASA
ncbi:DUF4214 domain-containing protein [Cellulomonas sp. ATA003]|uniref:DUF4214 domain-containing protein n=1 Tax=Cellulomonas sp. ATA003 TaxID=3073064 RepID=UPI0028738A5C|nr:DUF4214 domain-containing protein [Cellulomonas sp. ATA003]WNB85086.1 DUF4214 domain-containing protein [Cellulomonas sp. ATA003]